MTDPDARINEINTAWGRGYVHGILMPRDNPPWPPGATGDQWARGYQQAKIEAHGAVDTREPA